jgi:hypothetical protein
MEGQPMANEPKPAAEKRTPPDRRNAQGDHEGSAHDPSEFDAQNPAKVVEKPGKA